MTAGRMVLGVGVGDPIADEFGAFGEPTDRKVPPPSWMSPLRR